jgi:DNA mismatch repair protein MSH6
VTRGFAEPLTESLNYFRDAFDHQDAASTEKIQLHKGYDEQFDALQDAVEEIDEKFKKYLNECRRTINCKNISYKDLGKEIVLILLT